MPETGEAQVTSTCTNDLYSEGGLTRSKTQSAGVYRAEQEDDRSKTGGRVWREKKDRKRSQYEPERKEDEHAREREGGRENE